MTLELFEGHLRYVYNVGSGIRVLQTTMKSKKSSANKIKPTSKQKPQNDAGVERSNLTTDAGKIGIINHTNSQPSRDKETNREIAKNLKNITHHTDVNSLSDNKWHRVIIHRPNLDRHVMEVDDHIFVDHLPDTRSVYYDLPDDILYVGGLPSNGDYDVTNMASQIKSKVGFQGCMDSLKLDGRVVAFGSREQFIGDVVSKCRGPTTVCQENTCFNGGLCVQQWSYFYCDCNMTSYSGNFCNESSLGLHFVPPSGGLITMTTASDVEKKWSKKDKICFGLQTDYSGNSVIVRLASKTSGDFVTIEMIDGYIVALYNMGKSTHRIDIKSIDTPTSFIRDGFMDRDKYRLNDGKYHVVRFIRSSQNASLSIDDLPILSHNPTGKQHSTFNDMGLIHIGASADVTNNEHIPIISKPYFGHLFGLSVNGLRISDLLNKQDKKLSLIGDVRKSDSLRSNETFNEVPTMTRTTWTVKNLPSLLTSTTIPTLPSIINQRIVPCSNRRFGQNSSECDDTEQTDYSGNSAGFEDSESNDDIDFIKESVKTTPTIRRMNKSRLRSTPAFTRSSKVQDATILDKINFQFVPNSFKTTKMVASYDSVYDEFSRPINDIDFLKSNNFVKKVGISIGLLIGSVIAVIGVSIFFITFVVYNKSRNRPGSQWKTFDKEPPTNVTKNKADDEEVKKYETKPQTLFHILPSNKKINSKEWYV